METTLIQALSAHSRSKNLAPATQEWLNRIAEQLKPFEPKLTTSMQYGEQSKMVTWNFDDVDIKGSLELVHITDVQFGHRECKYERVEEYRDWVLSSPNRYMLWGGDNVDAWAMWSPGTAFDQIANPQSQVYRFCEVWAPARHRVLGYVGGNHERRAIPGFGDLGVLISSLLGIPYSDGKQLVDIKFGKHRPFKVSLWHGRGGARTKGTIAQTLHRFMGQGDSQLYLMGHLHQAMVIPEWKEYRTGGKLKLEKVIGAIGTSFLNTWGTYGEIAGYSGSDVLMARAVLEDNGRWQVSLK